MLEAPDIIRMNIDRYRSILARPMADKLRADVESLLAEAIQQLALAIDPTNPRSYQLKIASTKTA